MVDENDQRADELYEILMGRITGGINLDRNNPAIRKQADAYSANEERSRRDYLADLAEKSGPMANIRGEERMAAERAGQRSGAFEAELMGRELMAQRDEIQNALSQAQGLLTSQQQLALQKELALLDNAIKEKQIGLQGRELDLRGRGLDLQGQGLGLQARGMDLEHEEFLRRLAFDEADRGAYWDAIRSGLID
jgi:hypothetical protein